MTKPIEIITPAVPETVVAITICPKCGQSTSFCPHCGGRFCNTSGCTNADPYHREECRDQNNLGD